MKLTNFKLLEVTGKSILDYKYYASVEVETGMLLWRKNTTRYISKSYVGYWYFNDDGEFTPGNFVERLERAYKAQYKINYLHDKHDAITLK